MSKDWQLRRGSLAAGHLLAFKLRSFFVTSEKRKNLITNFFNQKIFLYFCLKKITMN